MGSFLSERSWLLALVAVLAAAAAATPAQAAEDGLFGVRIGASYRQLVQDLGQPHGILFPSGSGMIFQTVAPSPAGGAGLPDFGQQLQTIETPIWAFPVRSSILEARQTQWVYDYRTTRGMALGIVLTGEGADAVVTDVIVAGFPQYLKGKPAPVRTAKGITLQSTFEEVLRKYGYPPLIEIYTPAGATTARPTAAGAMQAGGAQAGMRAAGGARGGMRAGGGGRVGGAGGRGGMGGRGGARGGRGGRAGASLPSELGSTAPAGAPRSYQIVLTGAPGGRGGMGGRGMRGGMAGGGGAARGGRTGAARGTVGTLPPLGTAPAPEEADQLTATAVVDRQSISFSRNCIMVYEGIAFTLHDMKVFRIHVSE